MGLKLNRSVNELFGYYLAHLAKEEATILPATWHHLTDEQLLAIRATVERNTPPERYAQWMTWVLASLNINELVEMFTGMKKGAPPESLENMVRIARAVVDEERWNTIKTRASL